MAKTICLSAGHGAGDSGTVSGSLREDQLTIKITNRAAEIIRKHSVNCLTVPDNLTLQQTINWINDRANQIDICVEVHINAGGGTGVEAWNYIGGPNESDKLSQSLANALADETKLPNRGAKDESLNNHGVLGFVHDTTPVAALAECGFIDHPTDSKKLSSPEGIEQFARGIARGSLAYIGVLWKPELLSPSTPPTTDAQKLAKITEHVWYPDKWWSSLWRVKKMREILPR